MHRSLLLLSLVVLAACSDDRRFTPEAWRQEDRFERQVFTADLVGRRLLIGKPKREVNQMLGPGQTMTSEAGTWYVGMDDETGKPIVLQVEFKDEIATRATVHPD